MNLDFINVIRDQMNRQKTNFEQGKERRKCAYNLVMISGINLNIFKKTKLHISHELADV